MIGTWKWRIVLSVAVVLVSIGMSPAFFNRLLAYSIHLYFLVSCLNVVPESVLKATFPYEIRHLHWTRGYWPRFIFWEYQLMVFLFWWWVGWKIDLRLSSSDCSRNGTIAEIVVGLGLSLTLFLRRDTEYLYPYRDAGRWLMMAWSAAFLGYSVVRLSQLVKMSRQWRLVK